MGDIKTLEHLVYFMQVGRIKLSPTDLKFITNLNFNLIKGEKVTTNQIALFEKLITKYQRQLSKCKLTADKISKLQWTTANIVASDTMFTQPYLHIDKNVIYFKSPFNTKFIQQIKNLESKYIWDRDKKHYTCEYGTFAFKEIVQLAEKHYSIVNYCDVSQTLLNTTSELQHNYWNPTLVKGKANYFICASNQSLNEATKSIPLSDDLKSLSDLSRFGVEIAENIKQTGAKYKFAGEYQTEININDLDDVISWLVEMSVDCVGVVLENTIPLPLKLKVHEQCKLNNIEVINLKSMRLANIPSNFQRIVAFCFSNKLEFPQNSNIIKVVKVNNTNPIDIK